MLQIIAQLRRDSRLRATTHAVLSRMIRRKERCRPILALLAVPLALATADRFVLRRRRRSW